MSDKPRALSTLPPELPAEADYDAICSAVMATERGRWFLEEYARRNRNADTAQVLAAIARIETVVAGERVQQANQEVRIELLEMARAIAQTRADVAESRLDAPASAAAAGAAAQPDITGAAERLRDIAWTMRACGVELNTSEQIEQIAESILTAGAPHDPADHRTHKLAEVLLYLEHRIDRMLDSHIQAATEAQDEGAAAPAAAAVSADDAPAAVQAPATSEPPMPSAGIAEIAPDAPSAAAPAAVGADPEVAAVIAPVPDAQEPASPAFDVMELRVESVELELAPLVVTPAGRAEPDAAPPPAADATAPEASSTGDRALDAAFDVPDAPPPSQDDSAFMELAPPAIARDAMDEPPTERAPAPDATLDHALDRELAAQPAEALAIEQDIVFVEFDPSDATLPETEPVPTTDSCPGSGPPAAATDPTEPPAAVESEAIPELAAVPAVMEVAPAETEIAPAGIEAAAAETEIAPAGMEAAPAETEIAPAEMEATPTEMEIVPAELEAASAVPPPAVPAETVEDAASPAAATDADAVAVQVDEDLLALAELFPTPPNVPADPEPPPESDVLSRAWETAIRTPPVFPEPNPDRQRVPSMWEPPADDREEPANLSSTSPAAHDVPIQPVAAAPDAQADIESDLFGDCPDMAASAPPPAGAAAPQPPATGIPPVPSAAAPLARAPAKPMPRHVADDPLAALTAMTDEERIALFT